MKQTEYRSLGIDLKLNTPTSVDEFDGLAKRANACLDEATNNVVYRGMLAEFRDTFLHGRAAGDGVSAIEGVEDTTGIARRTRPVMKDGKQVVKDGVEQTAWDETEGDFFKRVCAETKKEPKDFQSLADSVAASLVFDPTETERKERGPVKLAKMYTERATLIFNEGRHEKTVANIHKDLKDTVPQPILTGDPDARDKEVQTLGHYIKAHVSWKEKQALAKY